MKALLKRKDATATRLLIGHDNAPIPLRCGQCAGRIAGLREQMEQSGLTSTVQSNGNREILVPAGSDAE